ncbi:MAG TPA: hypothetical protein VGR35_05425 [Tepidisphaeraceae bacterium]|nr:hypothetical protein [Tepidisphaeraceae bacterium]
MNLPKYCAAAALPLLAGTPILYADAENLAGIHWWGLKPGTNSYAQGIDDAPATLLDSARSGGWDVETLLTDMNPWDTGSFYQPLYDDLRANKNVSVITRVDYKWGHTVPSPAELSAAAWANKVRDDIYNQVKQGGRIFQIGNEPNLLGEGQGWANQQITPAGYAEIYRSVRNAIRAAPQGAAGTPQVLLAPVSPGGVVDGVRWKSGIDWLKETIAAFPDKSEIDGIAIHAYGGGTGQAAIDSFRLGLAEQMEAIDAAGLSHVPVYISEWNKDMPGFPAADEAAAAQFVRDAFKVVDTWNKRPGNHNIVSMSYFVHDDADVNNTGGWDTYSLEYWKNHGNAEGTNGDLYTAFKQSAAAGYKAGLAGTRPMPAGVSVLDDFKIDQGRFYRSPSFSGTSVGEYTESTAPNPNLVSTAWRHIEDGFTGMAGQKLRIFDNPTEHVDGAPGWRVRHLCGSGNPSENAPITVGEGSDGYIGFFLRMLSPITDEQVFTAQLAIETNTTGGLDAGVARRIVADGEWHYYEWNLDDPSHWTQFPGGVGDGIVATSGTIYIDSILFNGGAFDVEFLLDTIVHNRSGSLAALVPEPGGASACLMAGGLLLGRRRSRLFSPQAAQPPRARAAGASSTRAAAPSRTTRPGR